MKILPYLFCVLCLVSACGEEPQSDVNSDSESNSNVNATSNNSKAKNNATPKEMETKVEAAHRGVLDGIRAPGEAVSLAEGAATIATEFVWLASGLTGGQQLVVTGTLKQVGQTAEFQYRAEPADKLVIDWQDGENTIFTFSNFDGDLSGNAENFLKRDHELKFRIAREGSIDAEIASTRRPDLVGGTFKGSIVIEGTTYTADLLKASQTDFEPGSGKVSYESQDIYTGTITAPNFSLKVNETYDFDFVYVDNAVLNSTRTVNNTWTIDGVSYSVENAIVRYETLNGWPNPTDYWKAEGVVLKGGSPVGQLQFSTPNEVQIALQLVLEGKTYELQTWLLKQ